MRAKEFVVERRQVNEVFPLLAAIPVVGASLATMTAGMLIWRVFNLGMAAWQISSTWESYQDKATAFGPNPLEWPEDEKEKIMWDIIVAGIISLVGPAAGKSIQLIKSQISKIPKEIKDEALEKIAPKMEVELKKVIKKDAPTPSTKVTKDAPGTTASAPGTKVTKDAPGTKVTPADIEKDRNRIMGANSDKQAELKAKLSGKPETPQEKLKRELLAKQAAKAN